jgi:hypothetical protein
MASDPNSLCAGGGDVRYFPVVGVAALGSGVGRKATTACGYKICPLTPALSPKEGVGAGVCLGRGEGELGFAALEVSDGKRSK